MNERLRNLELEIREIKRQRKASKTAFAEILLKLIEILRDDQKTKEEKDALDTKKKAS